ncbi:MAG: aldo/keto reductase, partial [Dehalococcoidia bacterium]
LEEIAGVHGTTPSVVALAWLLTRPAVVAPILGANSTAQLADLLPASELALSADEVAGLDAVSEPFTRTLVD